MLELLDLEEIRKNRRKKQMSGKSNLDHIVQELKLYVSDYLLLG